MDNKKRLLSLILSLGLASSGASLTGCDLHSSPKEILIHEATKVMLEIQGPYYYVRFKPGNDIDIYVLPLPFDYISYRLSNNQGRFTEARVLIQSGSFSDEIKKSQVTIFKKEDIEELANTIESAGHNVTWIIDDDVLKIENAKQKSR